jgi:hypothetical protein
MVHTSERIRKRRWEKPEWIIEVKSRRDPWDGELMSYYCYKEAALSPHELERLFSFEKTVGEERR